MRRHRCAQGTRRDRVRCPTTIANQVPRSALDHPASLQAAQSDASNRIVRDGGDSLALYTREAATEIATRFPRVPNPTLVMYVFPHLARDMPIPGYVTTFPTWESAPYALPGETVRATDVIHP